jgi:nucleotide-binding universal stress UspA family protein
MARSLLEPGTVLDGFTVGKQVHKGGMAIFYAVTHPDHATPLLMKVPILHDGEDPAAIVGFEMEQMVLPRLSGPHVPKLIALGNFATQPYIVYERIPGQTLYGRIEALPLPASEVAALGVKIATALHAVHIQHVVHLDIKPSNIIIHDPGGHAVLIDYGLSRHDQLPDLMAEEFRLPYGTAPYMAPEQVYGIRSDPRSDLFALGVLMYFFATGRRPFGDPQSLSGLKKRVWQDPVPPRKLKPDLPPWLQEIILRCLAPDPDLRHPTAAQLAFDLGHPDQVQLTPRANKLKGDPWTAVIKRRFHPDAYRPVLAREKQLAAQISSAPIVAVAVDLAGQPELHDELRRTVERVMATVPGARLACLNVMRLNMLALDQTVDAAGNSIHVQRLVQLKDWARSIGLAPDRISFHVLESVDPAAALLEYAMVNHVDHIVLGARTDSLMRNILGSVSSEIVQKAPCTVTVVRMARHRTAEAAKPEVAAVGAATAGA